MTKTWIPSGIEFAGIIPLVLLHFHGSRFIFGVVCTGYFWRYGWSNSCSNACVCVCVCTGHYRYGPCCIVQPPCGTRYSVLRSAGIAGETSNENPPSGSRRNKSPPGRRPCSLATFNTPRLDLSHNRGPVLGRRRTTSSPSSAISPGNYCPMDHSSTRSIIQFGR